MRIRERAYPHPVLSQFSDDIQPRDFTAVMNVRFDKLYYYIDYSINMLNASLIQLISTGEAQYVVHVECRRNFFRKEYTSHNKTGSISIESENLFGPVEVSFTVNAAKDIPTYVVDGAHPDYGNRSFAIMAGDFLAVAPTQTFEADKDYDVLKKISSIMQIEKKSEEDKDSPMSFELEGNKICIYLSKNDFQRYSEVKVSPKITSTLCVTVVLPVLIEALFYMKQVQEADWEYERNRRWFRIIDDRLHNMGINIREHRISCCEAAQNLLEYPLVRTLSEILNLTATGE